MYVFGIDLPVVEVYLISSIITVLLFIMLIFLFRNVMTLNKKLDRILKEEHEVKKELDVTQEEEEEQLVLMREMVKEMGALDKLTRTGEKEINAIRKIVAEIEGLSAIKMQEGKHLDFLGKLVVKLDKLQILHAEQVNKLGIILRMPHKKIIQPISQAYQKIKGLVR